MYNVYLLTGFLFVLAFLLIQYKPASSYEGFALAAVDPVLSPACTARSTDAQKLLARYTDNSAKSAELRLLVSKLCCMEADISSPGAGHIRVQPLQFRTSHDTEPASNHVASCSAGALRQRDIDIILDKFSKRGHELIDCPEGEAEFDVVVNRLRWAMTSFCLRPTPSMDKPIGARDMGFYEPDNVADLSQYQGISADPK